MDVTRKGCDDGPFNATSCAIWCSLAGLVGSVWPFGTGLIDPAACYAGTFFGAIVGYIAAKLVNRIIAAGFINRIKLPKNPRGPLGWLVARTWRFRIAAVILLPVMYIASFGPVCWIMSRDTAPGPRPTFLKPGEPTPFVNAYRPGPFIYKPLFYLAGHDRGPFGNALRSFMLYGIPHKNRIRFAGEDIIPSFRDDGVWWGRLEPREINALRSPQLVPEDTP